MKRARAAWVGSSPCQSVSRLAREAPLARGWRDQESESQRRQHHLRKGAHIDDAPTAVETLERIDRAPLQPELAVVIIFNHYRAFPFSPVQQRGACDSDMGVPSGNWWEGVT